MKILITSDSYLPRLGGAEVYAYQLATFLKQEGNEVTIFTTEQGTWVNDHENVTIRKSWSRNPFRLLAFVWSFYLLVRKAEVVHAIYAHKLAALAGICCLFSNTKLVVSLQGRGILDLPGNTKFYAFLHTTYRSISLKLAHSVVASCYEFADIAARYTTTKKIVYLPNLVDINEFKQVEPDKALLPFTYNNEQLIFTIRRLVPKNGVQFAVEAMPFILEKFPNAKLIAIGWGPLDSYLKQRVQELGIVSSVFFIGRLENFKLKNMLSLADVVMFPSTAESTSIACLESMSLGKPIVASNVGGYPEMVEEGKNGFLVNLTDTVNSDYDAPMTLEEEKLKNLAEAVVKLLGDKDLATSFGRESRRLAETKFSWQQNISNITSIYKKICKI